MAPSTSTTSAAAAAELWLHADADGSFAADRRHPVHPLTRCRIVEFTGPSAGIQLINVVSAQAPGPGYITVYPKDAAVPAASNLNVEFANELIANAALVTSDSSGKIRIFTQSGTDLIVDSMGVFAVQGDLAQAM